VQFRDLRINHVRPLKAKIRVRIPVSLATNFLEFP
jgi:hypothetical protein